MSPAALFQLVLFVFVLVVTVPPLGRYLAAVFGDPEERGEPGPAPGDRVFLPVERTLYRLCRIDPSSEQRWTGYASSLLAFSVVSILAPYILLRVQAWLPLNPNGLEGVEPGVAFNTAISFVTNTNWQAYGGETTMSHLSQMLGLTVQNFVSAAAGMAVIVAIIRGLTRRGAGTLGNFWVDMTRVIVRVLVPLSFLVALVLVSQGVIQNFSGTTEVATVAGGAQGLPGGPAASQVAIKQLGTNGGGFFNVNSAHPFENPNGWSNLVETWAILALPLAIPLAYGRMVKDRKQGHVLLAVMGGLWLGSVLIATAAETNGNPLLTDLGADQGVVATQPGGNMEGKEVRFGPATCALWAGSTTGTSNGSVNCMHDSMTPAGGGMAMLNMFFGEVSPGGVGVGLMGLLVYALLAVFIAGLMVGRTPEYLGKKIQAAEMKLVVLFIAVMPLTVLALSAVSIRLGTVLDTSIQDPGPHGLSEVLYAFGSQGNNNGSAFAGFNIQHLESLNDVIETITGIRQRETVPDWVVRDADQVELVDMTPEALRRRMAHGNIYAPDKVDAALTNYFRPGNLAALRELALLWVADKVDDALQRYMSDHHIAGTWETRERVVVAVTGAPSGEQLIRRAARMAQRTHGDLIGVHIEAGEGLATGPNPLLLEHQQLLDDLGGDYHEIVASDIADGLATFARSVKATQLVLGSTRRSRWAELAHGSVINKAIRLSGEIDIHVISYDTSDDGPHLPQPLRRRSPLSRRRQVAGWLMALVGLAALTAVLALVRDTVGLPTVLLLYLLLVSVTAAVGGFRPALATAVVATAAANWFFTQPYSTFIIDDAEQIIAVVVFIATGALVSVLVGQTARHSAQAQRARAEAQALAAAAARLSGDQDPLVAVLAHLRITFDQDAIALFTRDADGAWRREAAEGDSPPATPDDGERTAVGDGVALVLVPGELTVDDRRLLDAFTLRLADTLERRDLERAAQEAAARGRADELRTAILRAVSHDLRSPLASIKASATSLLQDDIGWTPAERKEFAGTIDEEADRLDHLVANLLDMSRIEAGVVQTTSRPVGLEEVIAAALDSISRPTSNVIIDISDELPTAFADAGLLERVVANLVANALEHSPDSVPVQVQAASHAGRATVRIADQGPGIDADHRDRIFAPFQRLGDTTASGVGLGLAVARGFTEAMGGELTVEDTPGGGLTVVLTLPVAEPRSVEQLEEVTP